MTQNGEILIRDLADANRCIRDLVALSTLPAIWVGGDAGLVASGTADALFSILRPLCVYALIVNPEDGSRHEAARTVDGQQTEQHTLELGRLFAPYLANAALGKPISIHNPLAPGMARMGVAPIGHGGMLGYIAAVSHLVHFPNEHERLLLHVAANQAAIAAQNAQLLTAQHKTEAQRRATARLKAGLQELIKSEQNAGAINPAQIISLLDDPDSHA